MENCTSSPPQTSNGGSSTMEVVLNLMIIILMTIVMMGMGCGVEINKLKKHLKRPTGVIIGFIAQFGLMPLLAHLFSLIFHLEASIAIALLIQASCPGGSTSNIAAYWLDGDLDLSITMTSCSTILALGMMPLLLFIYSGSYDTELPVPYETIGITLASLLIPIAIGIFLRYQFPSKAKIILKVCSIGGMISVLGVAVISVVLFEGQWKLSGNQAAASVLLPLCGMILGYDKVLWQNQGLLYTGLAVTKTCIIWRALASLASLIPRLYLTHQQRRTISMETGIQNTNLCGSVLLLANFPPQDLGGMFLVPIIYSAAQVVFALIAAAAFLCYKRKYGKDDCHSKEEVKTEKMKSTSTSFSAFDESDSSSTNTCFDDDKI